MHASSPRRKRMPALAPTTSSTAPRRRTIVHAVHVACLSLPMLAALPVTAVQAQPASSEAAAARQYAIPAGSLSGALSRFAAEAGVQLSVDAQLTSGLASTGLNGAYTVADGFAALLAGSGLEAVERARGEFTLRRLPQEGQASTLPAVTVTSVSGAPPVYAGGQVAKAARLGVLGNVDIMDAPFSITAYTSKTIEDQQARSVFDVIAADPGIRQASPSSYMLEFYQARSFTLNGYDISFSGMYGVLPYARIPVEIAERVEVLRGPSGMLYGQSPSGAVGGGINIVPKRAESQPVTRVTTSYASDSQFGVTADVGRRFGENEEWGIRVNGATSSGDTVTDDQSMRRHLGALALDYRGDRARASFDLYQMRYRINGGMMGGVQFSGPWVATPPKGSANLFPGTYHDAEDTGGVLRGEFDIAEDLTAYAAVGQRTHNNSGYLSSAARGVDQQGNFTSSLYPTSGYNETFSWEAGLRGKLQTGSVKHEWAIGGTGLTIDDGISSSRATPAFTSNIYNPIAIALPSADYPTKPSSHTELDSIAIADTLSFMEDRLRVTLGVRQQRVQVKGYTSVSPNINSSQNLEVYESSSYRAKANTPMVGIVFKPVPNVSLYANYIEGLTSGQQVTDINATNYGQVFPPVKTKQTEAGVKWNLGTWTNTFALFEIKKPSFINVYTGSDYAVDGSGEQRNRGVEWSVFGQVQKGLRVLGGAAYTDGRLTRTNNGINQGNIAFASPKWKLNLGGEWDVTALPGLTLTAAAIHNSWSWANAANTQRLSSWTRYDLGARYATEIAGKLVTFRATVQNATDKAYWDANFRDGLVTLSTPRTVLLSAAIDF